MGGENIAQPYIFRDACYLAGSRFLPGPRGQDDRIASGGIRQCCKTGNRDGRGNGTVERADEGSRKSRAPFTKRLFPELSRRELKDGKPAEGSALEAITLNLSANFLGLGNAATPLGITAMERMAAASPGTRYATDEMVMFLVCNTAAVQIFPSTLAAVRQAAGAARPLDVLPAVWVSSLVTLAVSVGAACGMSRLIRQEKRYFLKGRQKI